MPEPTCDPQDAGFAFTDEDFARRYASGAPPTASDTPCARRTTAPAPGRHGGGNSFMRALRRRRAASSATAVGEVKHPLAPEE